VRLRSQSGMTLVELLVAMSVMTIVLVGATGVLFRVSDRFQSWQDRIADASAGSALAAAIQADSHRYVVCGVTQTTLRFCLPSAGSTEVTYTVQGSAPPYPILRQEAGGSTVLVARAPGAKPYFWSECLHSNGSTGTVSGHIHVRQYRAVGGSENFSVYYHAPMSDGGCP
jgi:prepilin-type N-terminal cleavage/methylation domain-containing protein